MDVGVEEIAVEQVIGSMGRAHEFDGCFRPRTQRLRRVLDQIKAARPNAADLPISVYQVDHAYFVVDGHKRMALAVEEGREMIDADVGRFASRFHVAGGTTMQQIQATAREARFRQVTGLDVALPDVRFPLGDIDGYLDLEESLKAHAYDLSREQGRLVPPAEAARHWYEHIYRAAVEQCTEPIGAYVHNQASTFTMAVCAPTKEEARETARESFEWYPRAGARLIASVADMQKDRGEDLGTYSYAADLRQVADDGSLDLLSLEYLTEIGACVLGTPDQCIDTCRRYEAAGVDQLLCLVNPYKIPHEAVMQTIEMMGEHVIPKLDTDPVHRTDRMRASATSTTSAAG